MSDTNVVVDPAAIGAAIAPEVIAAVLKHMQETPAIASSGVISPDGGAADKEVKTFADYLVAVKRNDETRLEKVYGVKAALSESGGPTGGYTVPVDFSDQIMKIAAEQSIVRPRAFVYPMRTRTSMIPVVNQTTAPTAGNTAFFGGMVMSWTDEASTINETEPTFRSLTLNARKLAGYMLASSEILADNAVGLEALLKNLAGGAIAWYEDYAFLRGDGVAKPLGVQNAAAAISVTRNAGGADVELVDLTNMLKRLLPQSQKNAVWIAHPFVLPSLVNLSLANASAVSWVGSLTGGIPATLMGIPLIFSEKMATSGSPFDLALCDFSYYVIGDRKNLEMAVSEHFRFQNDQIAYRVTERVEGQPWLNAPITLADAASTVSPFVYLT